MRKIALLLPIILLFLVLTGCNSNKQSKSQPDSLTIPDSALWDISGIDPSVLLLPPADLMLFINELNLQPDLINPVNNRKKYIDVQSKCLNLGVYISDLIYLSLLDDKLLMSNYLNCIRQMTNELKIYNVLTENMIARLRNNLNNPDSLFTLSGLIQERYVKTLSGSRENILAMISIGIFIESLYLILNNLEDYQDFNEINGEIQNQKIIFEQYYAYAGYLINDPKVSKTLDILNPLKSFLDEIKTQEQPVDIQHDSEQHFTLEGGQHLILTPDDYKKLNKIVSQIRLKITQN